MEEEVEFNASITPRKRSRDEISLKKEKSNDSVNVSSTQVSTISIQSQVEKQIEPTSRICLPEKEVSTDVIPTSSGSSAYTFGTNKNEEPTTLDSGKCVMLPQKKLCKIELEAIFYPKFDNENRNDRLIRKEMLTKVADSLGYIEVTLKHSGSLILWSGGDRYYSKNSADNLFTGVGEIMLRQHFARSWKQPNKNCTKFSSNVNDNSNDQDEKKYKECSDYVSQKKLTLSFEVVTAVLGHHGALPKHDYLVLTAVADRKTAQFMSSPDLISFSQQFRLPHNDTWLFQSQKSSKMLFQLYETSRENGLADNIIPALTQFADGGHVQSLYPHSDFQGNILEGIVIRYVPYDLEENKLSGKISHSEIIEEKQKQFKELASQSNQILNSIIREEVSNCNLSNPTVLSCRLRDIMRKHFSDNTAFQREIQNILQSNDQYGRRILSRAQISSNNCSTPGGGVKETIDMPSFVKNHLSVTDNDTDEQTRKILNLLENLKCFGRQVSYKIFHEKTKQSSLIGAKEKWLCIIHVHHDETFKKYVKKRKQGDMALFRGFCIHLIFEGDELSHESDKFGENETCQHLYEHSSSSGKCNQWKQEPLLLKMKFLPYMVRTFICRNGLDILSRSGVKVFNDWAQEQMRKWEISDQNLLKWMPFFRSWGVYAKTFLDNFQGKTALKNLSSNINEIPLNQKNYLFHLDHFSKLFDEGERWDHQPNSKESIFRGSLFIIGLDDQETEKLLKVFVENFNILRTINDIKSVQEINILESLSSGSGGLGCYGTVENSLKVMKTLSKNHGDSMFVVSYGLTENEINSSVENLNRRKKVKNMALALSKSKYRTFISLPFFPGLEKISLEDLSNPSSNLNLKADVAFCYATQMIKKASESLHKPDDRRGLFVFFPCIPGSGKSTLCNFITSERLLEKVKELNLSDSKVDSKKTCQESLDRNLVIRSGDEVKGKYWRTVEKEKIKHPSSIYIADKNVPPVSWGEVANICLKTIGVCISAVPSGPAISTTTVTYCRGMRNGLKEEKTHQYPYSLLFLAVCMERVLSRQKCSHPGRLDSGMKDACMVVAKFYSFYRNITAENFKEKMFERIAGNDVKTNNVMIEFPCLSKQSKTLNLPEQLENALLDAINYHYVIDNKLNTKTGNNELNSNDIENRLRSLLLKHKEDLRKIASPEIDSKQAFLTHVAREICQLDTEPCYNSKESPEKYGEVESALSEDFFKIVSIDVDFAKVHHIIDIMRKVNQSLEGYLTLINNLIDHPKGEVKNVQADDLNNRFIENTHVTLVHYSTMSQSEMRTAFGALEGKSVDISVDSFLFNEKVAAFSVSCARTTSDGDFVPESKNKFPHITVFCAKGISAKEANELPEAVEKGTAKRIDLDKPYKLQGTVSFWKK